MNKVGRREKEEEKRGIGEKRRGKGKGEKENACQLVVEKDEGHG